MSYQSIFRPDLFRDQVMVVTGGGSGIGGGTARSAPARLGAAPAPNAQLDRRVAQQVAQLDASLGRQGAEKKLSDLIDQANNKNKRESSR